MKRFSNILFVAGTDDSAALSQAVTLANNNQAKLTVVGLVEVSEKEKTASDARTKQMLDGMIEQCRDELQSLVQNVSGAELKVLVGKGFMEVIREVLRHKRDLVIKSAEDIDGIVKAFTSTDMKLLRKCPCPVWLIKPTQHEGYREILAALDYDPEETKVDELNGQVLEMATSLALADFAELHIVHAWRQSHEGFLRSPRSGLSDEDVDKMIQEDETKRLNWLDTLVNTHCGKQGEKAVDYLKPQLHLRRGRAGQIVPALAAELGAELIVMGTVGRAGIPGFLIGNTAEAILDQIDCSVLAVKPAGFVSPVTLE